MSTELAMSSTATASEASSSFRPETGGLRSRWAPALSFAAGLLDPGWGSNVCILERNQDLTGLQLATRLTT